MAHLFTIAELRRAIRTSRVVYAQLRFGCSEHWSKISKAEALALVATFEPDTTPEAAEMFGGTFGDLDKDGALWLG
ncbi:MAG: hypothetical protein DMF06_05160 [Verrucomicrobia bacterium]|nr:MAG: hypothetical protein DMF06_05160 [Verrucomicrobiota bacterium]